MQMSSMGIPLTSEICTGQQYRAELLQNRELVSWSLTSLFSTNMAISETIEQGVQTCSYVL